MPPSKTCMFALNSRMMACWGRLPNSVHAFCVRRAANDEGRRLNFGAFGGRHALDAIAVPFIAGVPDREDNLATPRRKPQASRHLIARSSPQQTR